MEEGIVRKKIQPVVSPKTSENPGGAKRNSCGFSSFNRRCSGWFSAARMAGERRLASKIQIGTKLAQKGGRKWEIWPGHVCGFQLGFSSRLSGSIPHFLGNLSNLAVLHLGDNSLFGSIPPILGKVQSLLSLGFDLNLLNGVLPPSISNLSNLEGIDISYNELRGLIRNSTGIHYNLVDALQGNKGLCGDVDCFQHCKDYNDFWKNEEGFKRKQIIRATNNFDAKYCISTGGQASVYKAELPSWEIVAVKKFHSPHPDMVVQQAFSNEIKALTELRHRNIVKFYGFSFHPRQSFLLYEYLGRGSLAIILSNDAAIDEFSWTVRMNVIKSVANTCLTCIMTTSHQLSIETYQARMCCWV
ncbi:MDIS1-interacting receptor like kinase 2 [Citrus sinensis]|uniref:MDIS1-interacting receptor like kinase 2 n=1 Tax=Citrus sinensis TaxID=2711 RepID=A0ACB8MA27_CITSI|nr:MDIS1-interacting receptor like kinase 2 [Citrus sinensis]